MRRFRFNIASLLVIVFILGVGFAALREASALWESGLFTLTLGVLLTSILLAIHRTEKRRAFWMGFAIFGWIYLGLTLVPSIEFRLTTTKALGFLDSKVPRRSPKVFTYLLSGIGSRSASKPVKSVVFTPDGNQIATTSQGQVRLWDVTTGEAPRRVERHNREFRANRTLAVRSAGGLVCWTTLSPPLSKFEIGRAINGGRC